MKELRFLPKLDESTRKQGMYINGVVYSLHITEDYVFLTDNKDYTKIYQMTTIDFWNSLYSES